METRVKKWGNSLALRIPKLLALEVGLEDEAVVDLELVDGKLVITPVAEGQLRLEDFLAQITEENIHDEVATGTAVGGEVW